MKITEEVANFIISYAEQDASGIALIVYNSESEEVWLKVAPKLNAISQYNMKFRDWMRVRMC